MTPLRTSRTRNQERNTLDDQAYGDFVERKPQFADRAFVYADPCLLFPAVQRHNLAAAANIERVRAVSIMLRSSCGAFVVGALVPGIELITRAQPWQARLAAFAVLLGCAGLARSAGSRFQEWATFRTYSAVAWIPEIASEPRGHDGEADCA